MTEGRFLKVTATPSALMFVNAEATALKKCHAHVTSSVKLTSRTFDI